KFHNLNDIPEAYKLRFDAKSKTLAKSLVFLMIPLLAIFLALLQHNFHKYFVEHLIFSTHFYAFDFFYIYCLLFWIIFSFPNLLTLKNAEFILSIITLIINGLYFFIAFGRFYMEQWWKRAIKALILALALSPVIYIYRFILFCIAFFIT
ncbi:MAG: hypothetical protein D6732_13210, partial [Methanobacteriota archaeon]